MGKFLNNGDKIFEILPDFKIIKRKNKLSIDDIKTWNSVAESYYSSAKLIAKLYSNSNNYDIVKKLIKGDDVKDVFSYESFVYLFLYRHYLELTVKAIYFIDCINKNDLNLSNVNHNVNFYWYEIKNSIIELGLAEDVNICENIIDQFKKIDPKSIRFRYPYDREGEFVLSGKDHYSLSPAQIPKVFKKIKEMFDYIIEEKLSEKSGSTKNA